MAGDFSGRPKARRNIKKTYPGRIVRRMVLERRGITRTRSLRQERKTRSLRS